MPVKREFDVRNRFNARSCRTGGRFSAMFLCWYINHPLTLTRCIHFWYSLSEMDQDYSIFPSLRNPMALINDYCGPNRDEASMSTLPPPNCRYCVVKISGWPYIFVVMTRDIEKGEPLRVDYGDNFWTNNERLELVEHQMKKSWQDLTHSVSKLCCCYPSIHPASVGRFDECYAWVAVWLCGSGFMVAPLRSEPLMQD